MSTNYIDSVGGRIAFDVTGEGPLVVCVPGMGDTRATYRHLVPLLVAAGYRVATMDLRGHGDSDTTFDSYDDIAGAEDVALLIRHLGGPATVVGNSMGAAIGVILAAEHPELVAGLALLGPFVRNGSANPLLTAVMRVVLSPPLVATTWKAYLPSLYAGDLPADHAEHVAAVAAAIRAPGHRTAVSRTMRTSHAPSEAALPRVSTPVLVVMGELDPDFRTPEAEAEWIVGALGGRVVMVPQAGHYPQSQRPDVVAPAIVSWMNERSA